MAGFGNTQIINGQTYTMYTPAWYDAQHAEALRTSTAMGTAQGSALKAASDAAGVPIGSSSSSSGSTTSSSSGSGSGLPGTVQFPGVSPSMAGLTAAAGSGGTGGAGGTGYSRLAPVDTSAAESAAFAHAKDQVGQTASGALTGLRSALGSRGMLGSGLESRGTAAAAVGAAGQLGEVSRQQAITRANEAQKEATTNFEGNITERGQDFAREEAANTLAGENSRAAYSGAIAQRGQDIQAANAAKALELEQAQLASQQRSTALSGLKAALDVTSPSGLMY